MKYTKLKCHIGLSIKFWMSECLINNIRVPKLMDLGVSTVTDILFVTKHKNDHNGGPNLNINKILSVLDSPGNSQKGQKKSKNHFRIMWA